MDISQSTYDQYMRIAVRLQKNFQEDVGKSWNDDPMAFAAWFQERARRGIWSRRTFWLYRSAAAWFMRRNGPLEATRELRGVKAHLPGHGVETSAKKHKKLPEDSYRILTEKLASTGKWSDKILLHWLEAGRYTGLRPCEWEHAVLDSSELVVVNAKRNAVRANGATRKIIFDWARHQVELVAIQRFLRDIDAWLASGRSFRELYDMSRKRLFYLNRMMVSGVSGRGITLYSPRHQFAADMKASGLTKAQVAALMGHASENSATIHYARRRDGQKRIPPRSPAEEVATVRRETNPASQLTHSSSGNAKEKH